MLFPAMAPTGEKKAKTPAAAKQRAPMQKKQRPSRMVKKDIGGDKNGGSRIVRVNRLVSILMNLRLLWFEFPSHMQHTHIFY